MIHAPIASSTDTNSEGSAAPSHEASTRTVFFCIHLARPCIWDASLLLAELADAAGVDVTALRRSSPGLAQRLDCLAAAVQDAVQVSRAFWAELCAALTAQRAARPTRARVVRSSLCLHRRQRKLLAKAWQTRACDPSTGPACAGLLRGVVSRERRALFSNAVELADVLAMGGAARVFSAALRPASAESREDFDNHAG